MDRPELPEDEREFLPRYYCMTDRCGKTTRHKVIGWDVDKGPNRWKCTVCGAVKVRPGLKG